MKDAAIRIRVERDLHASFKAACQAGSRQASDVLREFMEFYAKRHQAGQSDLFSGQEGRSARRGERRLQVPTAQSGRFSGGNR